MLCHMGNISMVCINKMTFEYSKKTYFHRLALKTHILIAMEMFTRWPTIIVSYDNCVPCTRWVPDKYQQFVYECYFQPY